MKVSQWARENFFAVSVKKLFPSFSPRAPRSLFLTWLQSRNRSERLPSYQHGAYLTSILFSFSIYFAFRTFVFIPFPFSFHLFATFLKNIMEKQIACSPANAKTILQPKVETLTNNYYQKHIIKCLFMLKPS